MNNQDKIFSIKLTLGNNSFELQGSETFINNNMHKLLETIQSNHSNTIDKIGPTNNNKESISNHSDNTLEKYRRIVSYDNTTDKLHIMGKIPGNNKADKAKNIALITAWTKKREITGNEIIDECKKQACYDPKNFSATFKRDSMNFIKNGKGQSWTLQLTINGEEEAIKVLDTMLNERSSN